MLPAQPTVGTVDYVPLGGDGLTAPFAAYNVKAMSDTGDATGGAANLTVRMDPKFCSLISYCKGGVNQTSSADADFRFRITADKHATAALSGVMTAISATVNGNTVQRTWFPPGILLPGGDKNALLGMSFLNVDTDLYQLDLLVYLFNIRVRELTPMGPLMFARGTGPT